MVQISENCDASQLEVEVFETAFGKTWLNHNALGTEFFNAKGLQLVDVQGDQQITKVGVQLGAIRFNALKSSLYRAAGLYYIRSILRLFNVKLFYKSLMSGFLTACG